MSGGLQILGSHMWDDNSPLAAWNGPRILVALQQGETRGTRYGKSME